MHEALQHLSTESLIGIIGIIIGIVLGLLGILDGRRQKSRREIAVNAANRIYARAHTALVLAKPHVTDAAIIKAIDDTLGGIKADAEKLSSL